MIQVSLPQKCKQPCIHPSPLLIGRSFGPAGRKVWHFTSRVIQKDVFAFRVLHEIVDLDFSTCFACGKILFG